MTTFNDRERAEEAKYAHDEEMVFRVHARRNRLLGEWAAGRMGLSAVETEAYAKSVVQTDFEEGGDEDVVRKLIGDLISAGVETDDAEIRSALQTKQVEARRQLMGEV
ncbi:MAG TPA: DUF1476 domain-containing protein [Novosphingobium sp.]|nr:DUF1476 domain-containing protein [Novosphingobium sp.]